MIRPQRAQAILNRLPIDRRLYGVEVGVLGGRVSQILLRHRPLLTLWMVDLWSLNPSPDYLATGDEWSRVSNVARWRAIRGRARNNTKFAGSRAVLVQADTEAGAMRIPDASLDFAFLDDDHSESGCRRSIAAWYPKIKPGGWIGGHDYEQNRQQRRYGVVEAADAFAFDRGLTVETDVDETWFVRLP